MLIKKSFPLLIVLILLISTLLPAQVFWRIRSKEVVDYSDLKPPYYRGYPNDMLYFVYWEMQREDTGDIFEAFTVWKHNYKQIDVGDRVTIIWDQEPLDWHTVFTYDPRFYDPDNVKKYYMNIALMERVK